MQGCMPVVYCILDVYKIIPLVDIYIYVIYKPWFTGVLREYTTEVRGQRKFEVNIARAAGEGYIDLKLPMTDDRGPYIHAITPWNHGSYNINDSARVDQVRPKLD